MKTAQWQLPGYRMVLGLLVTLLCSCTQSTAPPVPTAQDVAPSAAAATPEAEAPSRAYLLGPEDVIEVLVWKNPDLSRSVTVRPDGKVSLPLIGDVQAAGLPAMQLAAAITDELKAYYKEPASVTVTVLAVNSYTIYISGEVRTPGRIQLKADISFLQAITLAGGLTEFAKSNKITLRRKGYGDTQEAIIPMRYRDVLAGTQENIVLQSNDVIIVP